MKPSEQAWTLIRDASRDPAIIDITAIKVINGVNYVNQYYPQLVNFLSYFHTQFYNIIDMITNEVDMNTIISTARNLRDFINVRIESLNYIPGAKSLIAALEECETLLLDILQDLIDAVEIPIVMQRVNYLQDILTRINDSFKE